MRTCIGWVITLLLTLSGMLAHVHAQTLRQEYSGIAELRQDFPPGTVYTVESAAQAKQRVPVLKRQLEHEYAKSQNACYKKFFATRCLDQARQAYFDAKNEIQRVEGQANGFQHRQAAADKEKEIGQRKLDEAAQIPAHQATADAQAHKIDEHEKQQQEQAAAQQERTSKAGQKQQEAQERVDTHAQQREEAARESAEKQRKHEEKVRDAERKIEAREKRRAEKQSR